MMENKRLRLLRLGKSRQGGCSHCSSHKPGSPRRFRGRCDFGKRDPIYRARRLWREWALQAVRLRLEDPPPAILFVPDRQGRRAIE